jgi:hypothetical protein
MASKIIVFRLNFEIKTNRHLNIRLEIQIKSEKSFKKFTLKLIRWIFHSALPRRVGGQPSLSVYMENFQPYYRRDLGLSIARSRPVGLALLSYK